jgi:hypothetical protein
VRAVEQLTPSRIDHFADHRLRRVPAHGGSRGLASTSRARTWTARRHWPTSARAPPTRPSTATGSPTSRPPSAR